MSMRIPTGRFKIFFEDKERNQKEQEQNPMKSEEHLDTAAIFSQTIIAAVSELKVEIGSLFHVLLHLSA